MGPDGPRPSTGVSADPRENPDATLYREITHREALEKQPRADATAFSLCMDNKMPMLVFNLLEQGNIASCRRGRAHRNARQHRLTRRTRTRRRDQHITRRT